MPVHVYKVEVLRARRRETVSSRFRFKLSGRIAAFGVPGRWLQDDADLIATGCAMFRVSGATVDEVWDATERMTKAARSKLGRMASNRPEMAKFFSAALVSNQHQEERVEPLYPEREERIAIGKARMMLVKRPAHDPARQALEQFLRRPRWSTPSG